MMRSLFSNLENERWNWAEEALERFEGDLKRQHDIGDLKERVLIGAYGVTQVGKTTLILNLIGIRSDKIEELAQALRGSSGLGNSSTLAATLYRRSVNDSFFVKYPNGGKEEFETLGQLKMILGKIRIDIENK